MKMNKEDYLVLLTAISELPKDKVLAHKELKLGIDKDKRFVWDLFSAAKLTSFACDTLYKYLDDSHIETALHKVARELDYL